MLKRSCDHVLWTKIPSIPIGLCIDEKKHKKNKNTFCFVDISIKNVSKYFCFLKPKFKVGRLFKYEVVEVSLPKDYKNVELVT